MLGREEERSGPGEGGVRLPRIAALRLRGQVAHPFSSAGRIASHLRGHYSVGLESEVTLTSSTRCTSATPFSSSRAIKPMAGQ